MMNNVNISGMSVHEATGLYGGNCTLIRVACDDLQGLLGIMPMSVAPLLLDARPIGTDVELTLACGLTEYFEKFEGNWRFAKCNGNL